VRTALDVAYLAAFMLALTLPFAAVWLASLTACGLLELARARIAEADSVRAESALHRRR